MKVDTWIDRRGWGRGEWDEESDRAEWVDPATTYPIIMLRVETHGGWCGYVGVPEGHPWFGKDYSDRVDGQARSLEYVEGEREKTIDGILDVHGGITYASPCQDDRERGVCHKGEEKRWWFGFDTAHAWDISPRMKGIFQFAKCSYKNFDYVKSQCESLALQLKKQDEQK